MVQTWHGSCHCGAVRFEVDADLAAGTLRCNCRICTKTRNWGVRVAPTAFRLLTPESELADYMSGPNVHWRFCRTCGVRPFAHGEIPGFVPPFVSVQVATLDDAPPEALLSGPLTFCDGRADAWWHPPAETRHL